MKKYFFVLAILLSQTLNAQQRVGVGGGEAELLILKMLPMVPAWSKLCREHQSLCWKYQHAEARLDQLDEVLQAHPISQIHFADSKSEMIGCTDTTLTMLRSDLYSDERTRKTDNELTRQLIQSLISCKTTVGIQDGLPSPSILPIGHWMGNSSLAVFKSDTTNLIVSKVPGIKAQSLLTAEIGCESYNYLGNFQNSFWVQCKDDGIRYRVRILSENPLKFFAIVDMNQN